MDTTYEEMHTRSILLLTATAEAMTGPSGTQVFEEKIHAEAKRLLENPDDLVAMLVVLCEQYDPLLDYTGMHDPLDRISFLVSFNQKVMEQSGHSSES